MQVLAKQCRYGGVWTSRGDRVGPGGVLMALLMCPVVSEQWLVFQKGPEQGIQLTLMDTLLMMWQIYYGVHHLVTATLEHQVVHMQKLVFFLSILGNNSFQ